MQFLKQIKSKALTLPIFEKKVEQIQEKSKEKAKKNDKQVQRSLQPVKIKDKQQPSYLKQVNIKSIAKSIFHKFVDENKSISQTKQNLNYIKQGNRDYLLKQGKFWHVAPQKKIAEQQSIQNQIQVQPEQLQKLHSKEQVEAFISNLTSSVISYQNGIRNRTNKARNQIFSNIQIQPIYMHQNFTQKILKMELQLQKIQQIQRSQTLVIQANNIDRAIQNVLLSGYLWKAHQMQNCQFMSQCFQLMQQNMDDVLKMLQKVKGIRKNLGLLYSHYKKVNSLNKRRMIIRRKIELLKKIKTNQKDVKQPFQNIDQAFYIQRSRQKQYCKLSLSQLTPKIKIFQVFLQNINQNNKKLIQLIQGSLEKWIDNQVEIQTKHIQKLLILLYFTRSQKMYLANKFHIDLKKIKNKQKLLKQITAVQEWKDYRYVNDTGIKNKVKQFLQQLIRQIKTYINRSDNNNRKIEVTTVNKSMKPKQQSNNQIKI